MERGSSTFLKLALKLKIRKEYRVKTNFEEIKPENMHVLNKILSNQGVPIVAQQVTNLTSIHEDAGSTLCLIQWIKNPELP